jgi:anti-sigma B factor antagonist
VISLREPRADSSEVAVHITTPRLVIHASEPEPGPGGASVEIELNGVLDIETADQFREVTGRLVESGVARFSLALNGVSYLDSSGLGALVALQREVKPRSGVVELRGLQPAVRGVIELTRLDRVLSIRD